MKRVPATSGKPGFTVLGNVLQPKAGKDTPLKEGKGSAYDRDDPNLLRSSNPPACRSSRKTLSMWIRR